MLADSTNFPETDPHDFAAGGVIDNQYGSALLYPPLPYSWRLLCRQTSECFELRHELFVEFRTMTAASNSPCKFEQCLDFINVICQSSFSGSQTTQPQLSDRFATDRYGGKPAGRSRCQGSFLVASRWLAVTSVFITISFRFCST